MMIAFDNKAMWKMAKWSITIVNYYNQEAAAEGIVIERIVNEMKIDTVLDKVSAYHKLKTSFL